MSLILSAGAAGLMLGAILIAPLADRFGRRPIVLAAATTSAVAMIAISASTNWETLLLFRFLAGLAIGALVPSLSVIVVEFSNETRGNFFQIGRASCRERVCKSQSISVVAVTLKKQKHTQNIQP